MRSLSAIEGRILAAASGILSPRGERARLLVLTYHRVLAQPDPLLVEEPDARLFAAHMDLLEAAFNVLTVGEAIARLQAGTLPARAACITFDDGYANNYEVALPILAARSLPATIFISTRFIDGGRMWNDTLIEVVRRAQGALNLTGLGVGLGRYSLTDIATRRAALDAILAIVKYLEPEQRLRVVDAIAAQSGETLPNDLMLTAAQIRTLHAAGIEIGAHTINHPILTSIDGQRASAEIGGSKETLEGIIGAPVTTFAYPNGRPLRDYASRDVELVRRAGFRAAVSTAWGCARRSSDPHQIPRIAPWDRTPLRFAARMLKTYLEPAAATA